MLRRTPFTILFPYTTLFRSLGPPRGVPAQHAHLTALLVDRQQRRQIRAGSLLSGGHGLLDRFGAVPDRQRSEEHTSELQSRGHLVCRLLLENKKAHKK